MKTGGHKSSRPGFQGVVEGCLVLRAGRLVRHCLERQGSDGVLAWSEPGNRAVNTSSIGYRITGCEGQPILRLSYRVGERTYDLPIPLRATVPHFGGLRWWFSCPLAIGGRACGRRVDMLLMPPGADLFGCRGCYRLTYESCRQSHNQWDGLFGRMGVSAKEGKRIWRVIRKERRSKAVLCTGNPAGNAS